MAIPSKVTNFVGFDLEFFLPSVIFNSHSITQIMIDGNEYFKCSNLDCNFAVRVESATTYQQSINKTKSFINRVKGKPKIKRTKQRIIKQMLSKEVDFIPKQAHNLLEMFLNKIFDDASSDNTTKVNHLDIEKIINRFNQICPLKEESFETDFFAGDYADKLKQTCDDSVEDTQNALAKKFITNHFTAIQDLISDLFLKKIPYAEECKVSLLQNNILLASLVINNPDNLESNNLQKKDFYYSPTILKSGENIADIFKKLEFEAKTDIAFLKLKMLNSEIFSKLTNVYISHWYSMRNYISIYSHDNSEQDLIDNTNFKERKIILTNILDTNLCEINIEKLQKELEKREIKYDDLICNAPRKGGIYFEAIAL
jgi:uncharacterized C2H2 Zn-finger protein